MRSRAMGKATVRVTGELDIATADQATLPARTLGTARLGPVTMKPWPS